MDKYSKTNEEMINLAFLKFIPKFIVDFNLYDLYIEDERQALKKLSEKINEHKDDINSMNLILVSDFHSEKEKLQEFITRLPNEDVKNFSKMFLFYAVSIFENMIDEFLQNELTWSDKMSVKKANEFLAKLNADSKLDYLLKLLTGVTFKDDYIWSEINPVIQARNFYIHYKPQSFEKNEKFEQHLNKESILKFLDNSSKCYEFLYSNRNKDMEEYLNKINYIRNLCEEKIKSRK